MFRRVFLVCLISVLAMLQGVTPLIHAHAGGVGTLGGVHVDGIAKVFAASHVAGEHTGLSAPLPGEGMALGVGPEIRDRLLLPAVTSASTGLVIPPQPESRTVLESPHAATFRQIDSLRPPAQAPPLSRLV